MKELYLNTNRPIGSTWRHESILLIDYMFQSSGTNLGSWKWASLHEEVGIALREAVNCFRLCM